MTNIEKIKAEVEKRIAYQLECIKCDYRLIGKPEEEIIIEYKQLLSLIDSLLQEEPKGLDEFAKKASEEQYPPEYEMPDDNWKQRAGYIKGFKAGYMKGAADKEEKIINKAAEWIKKNLTFMHPRKEREVCMVNIGVFKDAMKEE